MRTHIELQDELLDQVLSLGHFQTKKEAVNSALAAYANQLKRKQLLTLYGKVNWQGNLTQLRDNQSRLDAC